MTKEAGEGRDCSGDHGTWCTASTRINWSILAARHSLTEIIAQHGMAHPRPRTTMGPMMRTIDAQGFLHSIKAPLHGQEDEE